MTLRRAARIPALSLLTAHSQGQVLAILGAPRIPPHTLVSCGTQPNNNTATTMRLKCTLFSGLLCLLAGTAAAQNDGPSGEAGQKTVHVVRTPTPPVIDGNLSDAVWSMAAVVDDLHQVTPIEYAEPYERTEIFILYDDEALYIGAKLYDTEPELITAKNMRQNDSIGSDDRIFVTIDPFNNRRSGYYFGVNPNGVRSDGLYRNVSEFYGDWDTIFEAAAGRFEGGWTAEIKIPFKSISFDPSTDTWGLNFSRTVVRKNETTAWVSRNRAYNPSVSGLAVGFEGLKQGLGD